MNDYELLYIVHPRKAADDVPAVIEWVNGLVQQGGGEVLSVDNWGRRRLAYPIEHEFEGTFVLTTLNLPPESTGSLESQLMISEDIVRHMLIRGIIPFEGPDEREREREERAVQTLAAEAAASSAPAEEPAAEVAQEPAEVAAAPAPEEPAAAPAETPAEGENEASDAAAASAEEPAAGESEADETEAQTPSPAAAGAE